MTWTRVAHWMGSVALAVTVGCAGGQSAGVSASAGSAAAATAKGGSSSAASTATSTATDTASAAAAKLTTAPSQPVEGDVLAVTVAAAADLNTFNRQPHTVVLVLYQVSQSSVFSQFLETPEGRSKLLEGESFDGSVLSRRRLVIQPGETQQVVLDRIQGARYLAAVAGYYNAQPGEMSRLVAIVPETTGMLTWKKPKPQLVRFGLGRNGFTQ